VEPAERRQRSIGRAVRPITCSHRLALLVRARQNNMISVSSVERRLDNYGLLCSVAASEYADLFPRF
jgi:hypothetical protein